MADLRNGQLNVLALMRTLGDQKTAPDKPLFTDDALSELANLVAEAWNALNPHHRDVLICIGGLMAAQQMRELEVQDLASDMLDRIMGRNGE